MLCFVALFVFAVLGIFSAKYRALAKEAFGCVTNSLTLRPCDSNLDERIKSTIIASLLERSPTSAKFAHKHFKVISLFFTFLFFASLIYSGIAVYNYWAYGNCNGPNSSAFCVFDAVATTSGSALTPSPTGLGPVKGSGSERLVEYGCFSCPYTKAAQPLLNEFLQKHPEVSLEFRAYPIPAHENSFEAAKAAFCADEQGKFWKYHDLLFATEDHAPSNLLSLARSLDLQMQNFSSCMATNETVAAKLVKRDIEDGNRAGIYGTPTFFLNGQSLVGPQSEQDFEDLLAGIHQQAPEQQAAVCTPKN